MRYFICVLCLFIYSLNITSQPLNVNDNHQKGLIFDGYGVNKDKRTSLDLIPFEDIRLSKGFTLEFELMLTPATYGFGYIFRIISEKSEFIDMISNASLDQIDMIVNGNDKMLVSSVYSYKQENILNKWVKVSIGVTKDNMTFTINRENFVLENPIQYFSVSKIYFGANKHKLFYTSDVPPMSVRNILIKDKDGYVVRDWDMGQHGIDVVYDKVGGHPATVVNGIWKMDGHARWDKRAEINLGNNYPQMATDSLRQRVFVATADSLYIINLNDNKVQSLKPRSGQPFTGAANYMIYDYRNDRLISYNDIQSEFITYDFQDNRWSSSPTEISLLLQHHNRFIDEEYNQLIIFGGYGYYKYNSTLLKHKLDSGDWVTYDLKEQVMPRYLSSLAYLGNGQALIMGGYGSSTGMQRVSPHNVYDLVQIDIRNNTRKKLGELSDIVGYYTFGNSMVMNKKMNKLYSLIYQNDKYESSISLLEVDMDNLRSRILTDSISYNFQDTESYCDLFLYKDSCLYAVVFEKRDNRYNVSVFSRLFPPLSQEDIFQSYNSSEKMKGLILISLVAGTILIILLICFYIYKKKNKNKKSADTLSVQKAPSKKEQDFTLPEKIMKSSISLLGGFQVLDSKGSDITGQFSPILRQMFLFCMLEYINTGKGITSDQVEELFWYDLDKPKAVNNRNVNIRKLRLLLQEIGNVSLQYENGYWQLNIPENVYCDYTIVMDLLRFANDNESISKPVVNEIIEIASSGVLLPNLEAEWVDRYKSTYSNILISSLLRISKHPDISSDLRLLIRLADVILLHDVIDEDSISIKCRSLYLLGQKGLSKQCYDKFCIDYQNILNEPPQITYKSIIG